jgi:hypothetical protein
MSGNARHGASMLVSSPGSSVVRTMPIPVRITRQLRVRLLLAYQRELKPFANVPGIGGVSNELTSQSLDKQKNLFPDGVDEHHVRKIDN